ncbi:MAG: hypothetical protein WDO15_24665 [Bacteroidota bacterium]
MPPTIPATRFLVFQLIGNSIAAPPVVDTGVNVSVVSPICEGGSGTVTLTSSENGIEYRVFKGMIAVSAVMTGGGDISIRSYLKIFQLGTIN